MTPATQVKLLRVLQERKFRRLGGRTEQEVDVRVHRGDQHRSGRRRSATGKLREDLYYRLNVFTIALPPLRDRKDDLPLLVQAFIDEFNARDHRNVEGGVDRQAMRHARALRLAGQRARAAQRDRAGDDPRRAASSSSRRTCRRRCRRAGGRGAGRRRDLAPGMTVDEAEQKLILATLDAAGGNKTRAAEMLGISLKTLHNKLNRFKERRQGRRRRRLRPAGAVARRACASRSSRSRSSASPRWWR